MNEQRIRVRRRIEALMLAMVLAAPCGVIADPIAPPAGADRPGESFVGDGAWAAATCGFSMMLAKIDPGFYGSAVLICLYAESLDQ